MENEKLLSELSPEEKKEFEPDIRLYEKARRLEKLLIKNGAVPGKDYTLMDLFKLAIENMKADGLDDTGQGLAGIEMQLEIRNSIESKRDKYK